jgi:glycosyltransferase involved in cell wall biosynthesis
MLFGRQNRQRPPTLIGPRSEPRVVLTVNTIASDATAHAGEGRLRRRTDFGALRASFDADVVDWNSVDSSRFLARVRQRFGFGPAAALLVFQRRQQYDVVWCFSEIEGMILAFLFKVFRVRKGLCIIGIELLSSKVIFFLKWLRVWTHFSVVLPTSTNQASRVVALARVPRHKVVVLPYQVDCNFFSPDAPAGPPKPGRYIVAAGLESRDYGTLFEAVRGLDVDVRIAAASVWAGRPHSWSAADVPSNVHIASYTYTELKQLYAGAVIAVVPLHETPYQHGITALQEAMAMALPVIVTRTEGQSDVVVDRRRFLRSRPERSTLGNFGRLTQPQMQRANGMYVGVGDAEALGRSIEYLLENEGVAQLLGTQAALMAKSVLSIERFVERARSIVEAVWNGQLVSDQLIWGPASI